jgi:hypothetical protein
VTERDLFIRFGVAPMPPEPGTKLGVSRSAMSGEWPIHGLRHPPEGDTNGWYVWAGEFSDDPAFFLPLHMEHVPDEVPAIARYMALPPGFRFLIAPDHEDVWEDTSLLTP